MQLSLEEFAELRLDQMRGYLRVHHPALLFGRSRSSKQSLVAAYATVITAVGIASPV